VSALQKKNGKRELKIACREGSTVKELLETVQTLLDDASRSQLFEAHSSRLVSHMMLMVNGRNMGLMEGEQTVLQNGDKILIWPLAGGG
jgi:molybdopterin converting factor small subunit